jgi:signal transduction histidine kinase
MIPQLESPPRVRVEWLIAGARVLLAAGTLAAIALTPLSPSRVLLYLLGWYLAYSLALLALVWTPVRFARGWDIVVHMVDVLACSFWALVPESVANPMIVYYVFAVVCGTIRWQSAGTMWTAAAAVTLFGGIGLNADRLSGGAALSVGSFATRSVYLLLIAALIAYLATHQNRFQYEIGRLASWPRNPARDPRELVSEIIRQSSEFLRAPRVVLVWEEPREGWVNVAWQAQGETMWVHEPEATYGAFVLPGLERSSFQANDASVQGNVLLLRENGFRRRECRPVNEALRARFTMSCVQSWPLEGELVHGRMFCLDKTRMRLDDLVLGEVVAWLAVSRLESLYWQERLRDAAALDERVRLARDLHDSLLQAQAGAALQLAAARRQLDRDPALGRQRLADVQAQLERDELEMRSFVLRLRPTNRSVSVPGMRDLRERLEDLRQRVERQWEIRVRLQLDAPDRLPDDLLEGAYRLVQEGVVNAARHADASVIDVSLSQANGGIRLRVADDGRGFPFRGSYDLEALNRMNAGPLTLRERVAELGGDMVVVSSETGAEILMTLPLARVPI